MVIHDLFTNAGVSTIRAVTIARVHCASQQKCGINGQNNKTKDWALVQNEALTNNKTEQAVQSYAAGEGFLYYNAENANYYLLT